MRKPPTQERRDRRNVYERVRRYAKKLKKEVDEGRLTEAGMQKAVQTKIDIANERDCLREA